jgi:hypothetical protein
MTWTIVRRGHIAHYVELEKPITYETKGWMQPSFNITPPKFSGVRRALEESLEAWLDLSDAEHL